MPQTLCRSSGVLYPQLHGTQEPGRGSDLTSIGASAIISPGPPRLGPDPKWDRRNALKVICRLVFEAAHQAVKGGGKVDHVGGMAADLWLSKFSINVRLIVRQKCHPFGLRWYQMATLWMRPGFAALADFQRQCISLPCLYGFPTPLPSVEWTSP